MGLMEQPWSLEEKINMGVEMYIPGIRIRYEW